MDTKTGLPGIRAIIEEMRTPVDGENGYLRAYLIEYADRLEKAYERQREEWEAKLIQESRIAREEAKAECRAKPLVRRNFDRFHGPNAIQDAFDVFAHETNQSDAKPGPFLDWLFAPAPKPPMSPATTDAFADASSSDILFEMRGNAEVGNFGPAFSGCILRYVKALEVALAREIGDAQEAAASRAILDRTAHDAAEYAMFALGRPPRNCDAMTAEKAKAEWDEYRHSVPLPHGGWNAHNVIDWMYSPHAKGAAQCSSS